MHPYPTFKKKIDGFNLNFAKIGHGSPLVFIHGWTNNWEGWIPLSEKLKKDFTLYLLDMPGFGHSADLPHYSIQKAAEYLAGFIKTLPDKPSLVSVSMGSFVSAEIAMRYPKIIHKAILTGSVINDNRHKHIPSAIELFLKAINKSSLSKIAVKRLIETKAVAYFAAKYMNMYRWNREIIDLYGMIGKKLVRKEAYVDMGLSAAKYDLESTLTKLSVPTLIIHGDKDIYSSYKFIAKNVILTNKNLSLKVIKNAGHVTPWEKPAKVASFIKRFLEK